MQGRGRGRPRLQKTQQAEETQPPKRRKVSESEEEENDQEVDVEENEQSEVEEDEEEQSQSEPEPEPEPEKKEIRGRPKKRVPPVPPQPTAPTMHQTYVMKLYDRSLDLARFKEDDPLYIICRDWLKNNPRVKPVKPEPPEEPLPRKSVPEILRMIQNGINADIKFLTPINKLPGAKRCPGLLSFQKNYDPSKINLRYDIDEPPISKEDIMRENMVRWKKIREHWQNHMKKYEVQYAESFEILDGIYRP